MYVNGMFDGILICGPRTKRAVGAEAEDVVSIGGDEYGPFLVQLEFQPIEPILIGHGFVEVDSRGVEDGVIKNPRDGGHVTNFGLSD
jgi:hypothetical protein